MNNIRTIVSMFLVNSEKGPLTLVANKKKAENTVSLAKKKGINAKLRKVFLPQERMKSLGENLFNKKLPCGVNEIITYRNTVINAFHAKDPSEETSEYVWKKVSNEFGITGSLEDFNQYCLDIVEYYNME